MILDLVYKEMEELRQLTQHEAGKPEVGRFGERIVEDAPKAIVQAKQVLSDLPILSDRQSLIENIALFNDREMEIIKIKQYKKREGGERQSNPNVREGGDEEAEGLKLEEEVKRLLIGGVLKSLKLGIGVILKNTIKINNKAEY